MRKKSLITIFLVGILGIAVIVGLSMTGTQNAQAAFLEQYDLGGLDTKAIVNELDSRIDEPKELISSITGEVLTLTDGKNSVELALPKDSFYLAFAPYENSTHPCGFHSLSSCRGELVNELVHTTITDDKGVVILDEDLETMDNGFVGVWLPKNIHATIQVSYNGKVATAPISTFADSETCLTNPLKLN